MHPASILYCQGNAWLALHAYEKARDIYLAALEKLSDPRLSGVTAHCCKNIGSALAALHDDSAAYAYYERALQLDPDLGEAHFAIALQLFRAGKDFHGALAHMEAITPRNDSSLPMSSVQGWRVELLFQNNDETGAFREIKNLLSMSDQPPWVWPFCARQVARFGRVSINATRKALTFWRSYLLAHPDDLRAERERLLCLWSLHAAGEPTETDFKKFKIAMVRLIEQGGSGAAFLWDRLGHWAQDEHDWIQAEEAYRKAYDLEPEHYGYCLGTALNFLDKHAEALPILLPQAEKHQPDAMSWFQVAVAREGVGDISGTIKAYELALELDPDYALAWFNLGGIYWNRGDVIRAAEIWKEAVTRFPNHSKTTMLLQQLPALFKGDAGIGGKSIF